MQGFYKLNEENKTFDYTENGITSSQFVLKKENKDNYTFPIHGWEWLEEAPEGYVNKIELLAPKEEVKEIKEEEK
jgi:hypothetical protein